MTDYRRQNRRVACETIVITAKGFYVKDGNFIDLDDEDSDEDFEKAVVILPEDAAGFDLSDVSNDSFAEISVTDEDSFAAARRLGGNCLVMNFANAHYPGGGFLSGANAQEESLCRESTLYGSLASDDAAKMYDYNGRHKNPCKYNAMILSPNVCVFRDIRDELLDAPFKTSVITLPALNKNGGAKYIPQNIIDEVMTFRLRNMFAAAAHYGYKNLVLGAWGCGAFGHDPETVSEYFYEVLLHEGYGAYFDKIVFAILDGGAKRNLTAFQEVFADDNAFISELETIRQKIGSLEATINKFGLDDDMIFHKLADISLLKFFQTVRATSGLFQDEGFTDTSAVHIDAPSNDFIEVKILVSAGKGRGALLSSMSPFPEECQFTLNCGTIYKILDITQNAFGIWQVTVEAVGRNPKETD